MARDYIKVDRAAATAPHAGLLLNYVSTLRDAYALGKKIKGIMDHNQDGTVFTDIATLFGLPAGTGQTVYNLVNGSVGSMEGTFQNDDSLEITERVG